MATELKPIFERVELILARLQVERECECCEEPTYPLAGSEDENGEFTKYVCINRPCPMFLNVKTE